MAVGLRNGAQRDAAFRGAVVRRCAARTAAQRAVSVPVARCAQARAVSAPPREAGGGSQASAVQVKREQR